MYSLMFAKIVLKRRWSKVGSFWFIKAFLLVPLFSK